MTQRSRLDAYLAESAVGAGAEFHDGEGVTSIDLDGAPTVRTTRGTYSAEVLIGADGANGLVGRASGLSAGAEYAVALEGSLPASDRLLDEWRDYIAMDLGSIASGYGWVFPKGDHLNVGVGTWSYAGFTLRSKLARLSRSFGFNPGKLDNIRGYRLPVRARGSRIADGRVAVVGDAAALVDPLTGEGIHMAFASGSLAADSAVSLLSGETEDMSSYQRSVDHDLQPELATAAILQELFHLAPPPYVALLKRSEKFWRLFCYLIRGDLTYPDFMRKIGPLRIVIDFLSATARRHRYAKVAAGERLLAGQASS
jgi:flavin-dependent dehydrogenase